jgi:carboxymethylenebutenolidase
VVRYADAEHGFVHDPSRPAHRADDAADAWSKVIEFLSA